MKTRLLFIRIFCLILIGCLFVTNSKSQSYQDGSADETMLLYDDVVYHPLIKTVQLSHVGNVMSLPVVPLHSQNSLLLSFDELGDEYREYRFTLIHCDAFWNRSDLQPEEYLEGFIEDEIADYQFSFNTFISYVHYRKTFPTAQMMPTKSGNYLLVVYEYGAENQPIFTRRMMVVEPKILIENEQVTRDQRPEFYFERQQVNFTINTQRYPISFPDRDLKVVVRQNRRWDNAKTLKPLNIKGDILDYHHYNGDNSFCGVNQYRFFDMKTVKTNTMQIAHSQQTERGHEWFLLPDNVRRTTPYSEYEDLNGRFFIKTEDEKETDTEAEYVLVHFFLNYEVPMHDGDFYILGDLTMNRFDHHSKMTYNFELHGYEATLMLKMGYYNYLYAYLPNGKTVAEPEFLEGNHREANNVYDIWVYYRGTGDRYDRLIGFTELQ